MSIGGFGKKPGPRKASEVTELGSTIEEHAAINAANPVLMTKLSEFEATYSRVVLVLRANKQILFATPEVANFLDLPGSSANDLAGTEFLKLLGGLTKEDSKAALDQGHAYSLAVGLFPPEKKSILRRKPDQLDREPRQCFMHLTPLSDHVGAVEAFVAVFR